MNDCIFYKQPYPAMDPTQSERVTPVAQANGTTAWKRANGKILSVQPDGTIQDRDAVGAWESSRWTGTCATFESDHHVRHFVVLELP